MGFSVSQNLLPILLKAYRELAKFMLSLLKLLKLFSYENSLMKVATFSSSCTSKLRVQESHGGRQSLSGFGAIWGKQRSLRARRASLEANRLGSCVSPTIISLINFHRGLDSLEHLSKRINCAECQVSQNDIGESLTVKKIGLIIACQSGER